MEQQATYIDMVSKLLEKITSGSNENFTVVIGSVNNRLLQEAIRNGIDLTGYRHVLDIYGVRHTFKYHGDTVAEAQRGQVAITEEDIENIPYIINTPDIINFSGKNKIGRETITLIKKMNDGTTVYIEEIRTGNKELALNSMRKHK